MRKPSVISFLASCRAGETWPWAGRGTITACKILLQCPPTLWSISSGTCCSSFGHSEFCACTTAFARLAELFPRPKHTKTTPIATWASLLQATIYRCTHRGSHDPLELLLHDQQNWVPLSFRESILAPPQAYETCATRPTSRKKCPASLKTCKSTVLIDFQIIHQRKTCCHSIIYYLCLLDKDG